MLTFAGPVIAFLFAILFGGIWAHWKSIRYLPWLAFAFLIFGAAILSQILQIPRNQGLLNITNYVLYTCATLVFAEGVLRRLRLRPNYLFNLGVAFAVFLGITYFFFKVPWLDARVCIINFGLALILLATALKMRKGVHKLLDLALQWAIAVFSIQFFPRTLLTIRGLPDTRDLAQMRQYGQSPFWIWLNLSFLIFTVLIGLLISVAIASDIIAVVKQESIIDSLTNLLNRRGLEEFVAGSAAKSTTPCHALIVFDLDDFKAINDIYGHHGGDAVLERVGALLRSHVRASDAAVRLGGEEFALLLSGIPQSEVCEVAERLRDGIANIRFEDRSLRGLTVTASIGVVEIQRGEALHHALQRADELMYTAKRSGKNRTVAYGIQNSCP